MNKTVNSNSKEILPVIKTTVGGELDCEGKILCVSATAVVRNVEALNKELRVNATVSFRAVTVSDDGEYDAKTIRVETVASIVNENVNPATKSVILIDVSDCTFNSNGGGNAVATLEIGGWFLKENEIRYLEGAEENVCCRMGKYEIENVACLEESGMTVTSTNEARLPIKKIIDYTSSVTVNNVYPSQGSFQIDGDVIGRLTAVSDSGIFITQTFVNPFSAEVNSDLVTAESTVDVYASVVKTDLTVTEQDARVFITETELKFLYAVSKKFDAEGICDCYSKTNDLLIEESVNTVNTSSCFRAVRDKISSYVKSETVIEEVLCACTPCVSDVTMVSGESLKVEGLISSTVVYTDETGVKTAVCETPFSTVISADFDCGETFFPEVKITSVSARVRSASEIEVTVEIYVAVRGTNRHELKMVSSIETGAEKVDAEYAISLYIVKPGETVWDVAKALNSDEDTILRLNPEIAVPLKGGEKVLVYNELLFDI